MLVVLVSLAFWANRDGLAEAAGRGGIAGQVAVPLSGTTITGTPLDAGSYAGRPLWLVFGASWCPPCRSEALDVEAAAAEHPEVVVVGVYAGEDTNTVRAFAQRLGLTYPQLPDPRRDLADSYRVVGLPTSVFVGADGIVRSVRPGALTPAQMRDELAALSR